MRFSLLFLLFVVVLLPACNSTDSNLADEVPLDDENPTFVYFYTDG